MTPLLTSLPFRIFVAILGILLFSVSLVLFPAALVNLPVSWLGVVETIYGMSCAVAAFRYFSTKKRWLLLFMLPAIFAVTMLAFNVLSHESRASVVAT